MRLKIIFFGVNFVFLTGMEMRGLFIYRAGAPKAGKPECPNMLPVS